MRWNPKLQIKRWHISEESDAKRLLEKIEKSFKVPTADLTVVLQMQNSSIEGPGVEERQRLELSGCLVR